MKLDDLHKSVDGLRALRDELPDDERNIRARADRLLADLERQIEELEDAEDHDSLLDDLRDFAEQFEAEHPRITEITQRISVMLSGMGI